MRVQSTNYNYNTNPSFGYWRRETVVKGGILRNDTSFFRDQNFFPMLTKFFSEKFKDIPNRSIPSPISASPLHQKGLFFTRYANFFTNHKI